MFQTPSPQPNVKLPMTSPYDKTPMQPPHLAIAQKQLRYPLHGMILQTIPTKLVEYFGWEGLAKTPWAREKVEGLYGVMLREKRCES